MLKKVAFVLALTVLVSFALALESGPSNTVGFNKVTLPDVTDPLTEGWVPFGLAFTFWDVVGGVPAYGTVSTKPSDVIGAQTTSGFPGAATELICKNTGEAAFRNFAGTWFGSLEDNSNMLPGYGFYFHNFGTPYDVVFAGEVDTAAYGLAIGAGDSYTAFSVRDARVRGLGQINLVTSGFTGGMFVFQSDELIEKNTGTTAWYNSTAGAWQGTIAGNQTTPGYYYWVHTIAGHAGYAYTYGPGAIAPPPERPGNDDNSINRITRPTRRARSLR